MVVLYEFSPNVFIGLVEFSQNFFFLQKKLTCKLV